MDKTKALLIAKMAHRECLKHKNCCQGCPFDIEIASGVGCAIDFINDQTLPADVFEHTEPKFLAPLETGRIEEGATHDSVNSPTHYCKGGIECIDAIRAAVSDLQGVEAVYAGNVIKYVWRFKGKNGLEDLKKAKHYLEWLIEEVEKNG